MVPTATMSVRVEGLPRPIKQAQLITMHVIFKGAWRGLEPKLTSSHLSILLFLDLIVTVFRLIMPLPFFVIFAQYEPFNLTIIFDIKRVRYHTEGKFKGLKARDLKG